MCGSAEVTEWTVLPHLADCDRYLVFVRFLPFTENAAWVPDCCEKLGTVFGCQPITLTSQWTPHREDRLKDWICLIQGAVSVYCSREYKESLITDLQRTIEVQRKGPVLVQRQYIMAQEQFARLLHRCKVDQICLLHLGGRTAVNDKGLRKILSLVYYCSLLFLLLLIYLLGISRKHHLT